MNIPFLSSFAAILYFAWQWHDRSAADRSGDRSLGGSLKRSNRTNEIEELVPAHVESGTATTFDLENVATPVARGVAQ